MKLDEAVRIAHKVTEANSCYNLPADVPVGDCALALRVVSEALSRYTKAFSAFDREIDRLRARPHEVPILRLHEGL